MNSVSTRANDLLKRLSRGMQALLLSVIGLLAVVLLWAATRVPAGTWKEFLNSVATGLLVSAAFGIAQALITSRVSSELLRASVVEEVSHSLAHSNNAYFPTNEFPASTEPNPLFNSKLSEDLANSSTFWFRGLSGRYAAARLLLNQNVRLQARLILPDPRVDGTLEGRAQYARRHRIYPGLDLDQIRARIKRDMSLGVTGVLEACHQYPGLELILTPMPLLDRYEIFRDAIWVTLYSDPGQGTRFPRSLRFSATSVMYLMQEADCVQVRNHPSSRLITFPAMLTNASMAAKFHEITGEELTEDKHAQLKQDFQNFVGEFTRTAGLRGTV